MSLSWNLSWLTPLSMTWRIRQSAPSSSLKMTPNCGSTTWYTGWLGDRSERPTQVGGIGQQEPYEINAVSCPWEGRRSCSSTNWGLMDWGAAPARLPDLWAPRSSWDPPGMDHGALMAFCNSASFFLKETGGVNIRTERTIERGSITPPRRERW